LRADIRNGKGWRVFGEEYRRMVEMGYGRRESEMRATAGGIDQIASAPA
jgi:hypothetical protein